MHDPGKVAQDLASAIALGGDCPADMAVVRAQVVVAGAASRRTAELEVVRIAQCDDRCVALDDDLMPE